MKQIFVRTDGANVNSGHSFDQAKRTIQNALATADHGDIVVVAPGVYGDSITIPENASRKIVAMRVLRTTDIDDDAEAVELAGDKTEAVEDEAVTEPVGAGRGFRRVTRIVRQSMAYRRRLIITITYVNPASSKAWAAEAGRSFQVEAF